MRSDKIKLISFSGIDGAGKSTQIEGLRSHLRELGFRSALLIFWDDIAVFPHLREHLSAKAFKGDQGVGSPDNPIRRRDKNVTSWYMTVFRLFLYLFDAYSLRVAVSTSSNSDTAFIIFDRYIYDELANLPLNHRPVRLFVRLLLSFVPRPDLAFLVDADPQAAHKRKPEYPLEFAVKNRDSYIVLSRLVQGLNVIAPLSVEETAAIIRQSIFEKCLRTSRAPVEFHFQFPPARGHAKNRNA